jgi:endonuclease G
MAALKFTTILVAVTVSVSAQHDRFGLPDCAGAEREFADRAFFVLCHTIRNATRPSGFRRDAGLSNPGAADADYRGSGYSRGHLAPAADFLWSDDAVRSTFLLSNAVPQNHQVNVGVWAQLERLIRRMAAASDAVYIFSGPLFESAQQTIGGGRIAVPSHTFKVALLVTGDERRMIAAIVPNSDIRGSRLDEFIASVDEVERRTGLDFFAALADDEEEQLESARRGTHYSRSACTSLTTR